MPAGPWSRYDDGGYSGGSTDGPDLQRLLDDSRTTLRKLSRDGDNVWRGAPLLSIHERGWRTPGPGGVAVLDLQVTGILLRSRHPEGDESSRARLVDTPMLYRSGEAQGLDEISALREANAGCRTGRVTTAASHRFDSTDVTRRPRDRPPPSLRPRLPS